MRSAAVPPVETISTPSSARPRANSTRPRLSDTLSSARLMRASPGAVSSVPRGSIDIVDQYDTRVVRIDADAPGRDQLDRTRQQPVLHGMHALLDLGDARRIRKLQGLLEDDWTIVEVLVHEVDGHPGDPYPVLDRLLDRAHPREGWEERRVDV